MSIDVIVADYGVCTALGADVGTSWERLLSGACAIRANARFSDRLPNVAWPSAVCEDAGYSTASLAMQMLTPLLLPVKGRLPSDALLLLATTIGEIDLLERAQIRGGGGRTSGRLDGILGRVSGMLGLSRPGCIVSCACASSSMAMVVGASLIRSGRETDVIVVGCDAVSEFVLAGFASLAALSPEPARPFDSQRQGLSLGEGAGWCWLQGVPPDGQMKDAARGRLLGWTCRADAYHMTAPDPKGDGLAAAVGGALRMAGVDASEVGAICAHGTGTRYNDEMEIRAFTRALAPSALCPIFSVKGHVGHTLGAAGVIEAVVSLEASRSGCVPPTVGCREPEPEGTPVTRERGRITTPRILSTNSGFGGVNTVLLLDGRLASAAPANASHGVGEGRVALVGLAWMTQAGLGVVGAGLATRAPLPPMDNPDLLFHGGYKNWGRVAPLARRLACVLELGFRELRLRAGTGQPSSWGILGLNAAGCHDENRAFFRDYLDHGRSLARGALFVQTLPSTPVAEASIHFSLRGPVCHFVDPTLDFSRVVDWGCAMIACGDTDGIVVAALEEDRVLCAFLRAAGPGEAGEGMGRTTDIARAIPRATPREWMVRFCSAAQGAEEHS